MMNQTFPENDEHVNQLVLVVVSDEQASLVTKKLVADGFRFTLITASNGLLPTGTTCLMLGIHSARGPALMDLVESVCKTRRTYIPTLGQMGLPMSMPPNMIEAEVGSASIYVLPVVYYEFF
jgi:uncharacterized protein YaaQ